MLIERRAMAQEHRVVPETITRFMREATNFIPLTIKPVANLPHTFDLGKTPTVLRHYERGQDWNLPSLANHYPRSSTDRDTAENNNLEWITPGHPLFEAIRRHVSHIAQESFGKGACFYSLKHDEPSRFDFYRARVVDGLGNIIHERLFVVELTDTGEIKISDPGILGDLIPAKTPNHFPSVATMPEVDSWLNTHELQPFLEKVRSERLSEIERIAEHVELSLTELLHKADEEIGRAASEVEQKVPGAEGRLAQAEDRHAKLLARREIRRQELERQRSVSLQAVERITSILVLPHPERETPEVRRLRPNFETEALAMTVVMEYEKSQSRQVYDVHEKNLGYDITSLDLNSGELRLIEVKGIGESSGTILLTPNERRVAEDRRDCYWLYVVTNCNTKPQLQEPIKDPARFEWNEVIKVAHYYLSIDAMTQPMQVKEDIAPYGGKQS
jgi:hypothetical protein